MASQNSATALRLTLQKEVFSGPEERLLAVAIVTKPGKKKKQSFLCVSLHLESKPPRVYISRVKHEEKKDRSADKGAGYRRVRKWNLTELRLVDGKSADSEVSEFDLHFDKGTFKWVAGSVAEKKAFVVCLYKLVCKYIDRKKPEFVNVDEERLTQVSAAQKTRNKAAGQEEEEEVVIQQVEEYQELSEREQEDLEKLLKEEEVKSGGQSIGIQDITTFTEHLSQQLTQLDDANIHMLMGSENQIEGLMKLLDQSLMEIEQMETKLAVYDELLTTVRNSMGSLHNEYSRILVWDKNLKKLLNAVDDIVGKLYLDPRVEHVLSTSQLKDDTDISDCTNAVRDLQRVMNQQLSKGVQIMQAVTEQKSSFSGLSFKFGKKLDDHLIQRFAQLATRQQEAITSRQIGHPSLPNHNSIHNELMAYRELMRWMRECQSERFSEVCTAYCTKFKKVYEEEIKAFFADVKSLLSKGSDTKRSLISKVGSVADFNISHSLRIGSTANVSTPRSGNRGLSTSLMDFTTSMRSPAGGGASEAVERPRLDQIFLLVVGQLQPVCISEQKFCNSFFHFPKLEQDDDVQIGAESSGLRREGDEETDSVLDVLGLTKKQEQTVAIDVGAITGAGVMGLLTELFQCLLTEIHNFIQFGQKIENYNALYLLMAVKQKLMFAREGGKLSYLDHCLERALVLITRLFHDLIGSKKKVIEECKVPRKSGKWGVLSCVTEFTVFAEQVEQIVMGTDQREEVNTAYQQVIQSLFATIERIGNEHPKTPDVVKFENYHKLYHILSRLKITCLEGHREEAKQKFRVHQQEYVITCLGKPLKNLSLFFEGVEGLLANGMKAEQIGFWRDYSKAELQKCISAYPGKEVKRGLEKLYRRIDGELTEEVGLLRVTWGAMQKAFIEQYEHFDKLMAKCYPGANMQLEFNLVNLNDYFMDISENK